MNKHYKIVLDLIKSAVTGCSVNIPDDADWKTVLQIAKYHQIIPMVFYGLKNSNIKTPYDERLFDITAQCVVIEQEQFNVIAKISKIFSDNEVDFAFLKGCRLKHFYPRTEMRVMGDLDILIKDEQYSKIAPLLEEAGFAFEEEVDYEYHWRRGYVHLELHKSLMPTDNGGNELYSFFKDGWAKFSNKDQNQMGFTMSKEDEFIFVFSHMLKHFRFSGIGIRHFTDIYVYLRKHPELDKVYIKKELGKIGLETFYENVLNTLDNWFDDGEETDAIKIITERVFLSGANGTIENNLAAKSAVAIKNAGSVKKARFKALSKAVFAPTSEMKRQYKILNKCILLLPFMHLVRWAKAIVKPKSIKNKVKQISEINSAVSAEFNEQLKKVGL